MNQHYFMKHLLFKPKATIPSFIKSTSIKTLCILFTIAALTGCSSSGDNLSALTTKINKKFNNTEGTFAMAFVNLADTSQKILINEKEMFHAASTMKTPVMIEVFKQAKQGQFALTDSLIVKNKFYSIVDSSIFHLDPSVDSYKKLYDMIGKKKSIRSLLDVMITTSSNLAANILVDLVGAKNVTQTMRDYGAEGILVLRGVGDLKAFRHGLSDSTNALGQMIIYSKLAHGKIVSEQASAKMIAILSHQQFNTMIPAGLPDSIKVAHKTGWITGVNHDCALVFLPDGRKYVLILLSKKAPNREKVHQMFADISHMIYKFLIAGKNK